MAHPLQMLPGVVVNAWFESMSGFSTTGATVISTSMSPNCLPGMDCINSQPRGLLFWRSLTQWFGGMGIIMLGMMILSRVIGGGMALGPSRINRTIPSIKAKITGDNFGVMGPLSCANIARICFIIDHWRDELVRFYKSCTDDNANRWIFDL